MSYAMLYAISYARTQDMQVKTYDVVYDEIHTISYVRHTISYARTSPYVTSGIPTPWIKKYILVYTLAIGPYTMPYDMSTCYGISHNKS